MKALSVRQPWAHLIAMCEDNRPIGRFFYEVNLYYGWIYNKPNCAKYALIPSRIPR